MSLRRRLVTAGGLAALGGLTLLAAHAGAARRARLGNLRRQFSLTVAVAVGQILIALLAAAGLMFLSHHDAILVAVIAVFVGLVAVRAAQLLAGGVLRDVESVRDGLVAVGAGGRDPAIHARGDDELAELASAANRMVEQLVAEESARGASESARRDLVGAVSHDLRTPITSLRLLAEAMSDDIVDDETRRRYLDLMTTHIRSLGGLIDDLFELSRLEAGEIAWSMERVRLDELVAETVAAMRVQADERGVAMVTEVPGDLDLARANPEKVQRVLFNLIQNAIRHTPADGAITVRAQDADDAVEVEVADSGARIPTAERELIFQPFFRGGEGAARSDGGAGLGLAISRAIVEAHGGRMWLADGAQGDGTRVRFSLPRAG